MDVTEETLVKRPTPPQLAPYTFKPGNPGGPGRIKGSGIIDRLREALDEKDEDGKTNRDALVEWWRQAIKRGSYNHLRELLDRIDGPVVQKQEVDATISVTKLVME